MMKLHRSTRLVSIVFLSLLGLALTLVPAQGYVIVFKDGFTIHGKIKKQQMLIGGGGAGGVVFIPMPGAPFLVEAENTNTIVSPSQIHDILDDPAPPFPKWMSLEVFEFKGNAPMPPSWTFFKVGPWDGKWERDVTISMPGKNPAQIIVNDDKQRISHLTPLFIRAAAKVKNWAAFYHPSEFGPEAVKKLLADDFNKTVPKNDGLTKLDKCLKTCQFLAQCGWLDEAEAELNKFEGANAAEKSQLDGQKAVLNKIRAFNFVEDLITANQIGRYKEVQDRLETYAKEKMDKLLDAESDLKVFEIKEVFLAKQKRMVEAQQHLLNLWKNSAPPMQEFFKEASQGIFKELNPDTLYRLETFLEQAENLLLDLKEKRTPSMSAEQVLSLALTGWMLGKNAAEENVEVAQALWKARDFILEYQNTQGVAKRAAMRQMFAKTINLDLDVLARLIQVLPPPQAHNKINTDIQDIAFQPNGKGPGYGYYIQLPPEYHHNRAHPVLVLLHDQKQDPTDLIKKWSKIAAKNGYILVAPVLAQGFGGFNYQYSDAEQTKMMNMLRDLRARFQIDSDRVFLFGLGQGGLMAFDVGMSHPDQFAGVLPMSAYAHFHAWNCRANAQYLPFYVVSGNGDQYTEKKNEDLFKNWVPWRYPVMWTSYKGRTMEWFAGEMVPMMNWMNHKVRYFPRSQAGAKDFGTMRSSDNKFYWISTTPQGVLVNVPNPALVKKWELSWLPSQMSAEIFSNNQINVYRKNIKGMTLWLAAGMVDFSEKVTIRNELGKLVATVAVSPKLEVLLEDFYEQGDRSRLFLDRIDLN